jgi:hypothetical protein
MTPTTIHRLAQLARTARHTQGGPEGPPLRPSPDTGVRWWAMTVLLVCAVIAMACHSSRGSTETMNTLAERYVRLVLDLGQHDADYVDAYYGPPEWRKDAESKQAPLADIAARADALAADIDAARPSSDAEELVRLRHDYLRGQVGALRARAAMLMGRHFRFDEESKALYDAVAPIHAEREFADTLAQLERHLSGSGSLADRFDRFRRRFVVPPERLAATFNAAIDGCRSRTLQHITLPAGESFTVEYVTNKSWSGYNWYQGRYRSLIQVNTDLPVFVERATDLACHEGYPGHHVYNVLLEKNLVRDRGWIEFTVYPLFSPQSLIAEGTANYGVEVAFPGADRETFERTVIFPTAGLDPAGADEYYTVLGLIDRLSYAGNEAARRYLDGQIDANGASRWLEQYGLMATSRAEQRVRFIDQYRSYVINYNLGKDMVAHSIESRGGTVANPQRRWELFAQLISSPRLPSGLQ